MLFGTYATSTDIKEYLINTGNVSDPRYMVDDQRIAKFCEDASRKFDAHCNRWFYPRVETRYYDHPHFSLDAVARSAPSLAYGGDSFSGPGRSNYPGITAADYRNSMSLACLELDTDLLEPYEFLTGNGATEITAANYFKLTGENYNHPPYSRLELKYGGTPAYLTWSGTPQRANSVYGVWGYHERWAHAWAQVDTVQNDPLTISETSLIVSDVGGEDERGYTPRFQAQQLGRFGTGETAEYFYIIKANLTTNICTIIRGVNGTTAVQQAKDTAIYLYRPMDELKYAVEILAVYAYRRKDAVGKEGDQPLAGSGILVIPSRLPDEVTSALEKFKRNLS